MRKKNKQIFHSVDEFEAEYFPRSFKEKSRKEPIDPQSLGISLAEESLDKIRSQLAAS
ncbi:MAG TPA: hypothetical protein PLN41_12300 [Methanothrix sp.]|jgi:hypothetical protein|nr:hypothetical protein [Methanothrix sp.]